MNKNIWDNEGLVSVLREGGVVVMPTDTIYGIVGKAESRETVNRIYDVRKRAPEKPCIILISDLSDLERFSVSISPIQKEKLKEFWSGADAISVVLDCPGESLSYLHRGTSTLAFRIPHLEPLRALLRHTGPLIAPSANTEKFPQSETVDEARNYFGDLVDLYVDGGPIIGKASKVVRLHADGTVDILRE